MSDELAEYRPPSNDLTLSRPSTDDWYASFPNIVKLAEYVADTEFVPDAMRRHPAAIAAAILTGREMGLPPMVSLRHLFVVRGRVGQSAELMRAQIYRAGHEIRVIESTDQRCVVEGRRNTEKDWTKVQFTAEDARNNQIDLRHYPADKLFARATSRLARRKFPDAVMGLPTVDELEDNTEAAAIIELTETPAPVQRKRTPKKPRAAATQPPSSRVAAAGHTDDVTELLDDQPPSPPPPGEKLTTDHPAAGPNDDTEQLLDDQHPELPLDVEPELPASKAQSRKLFALWRELGLSQRADRLIVVTHILGRDVSTQNSLTVSEASELIDKILDWQNDDAYPVADRINDILNTAALQAEVEGDQ